MAEVAYAQTGQARWWPAHALILTAYVLFALFLGATTRLSGLTDPVRRRLRISRTIAWFGVLAMTVHLLLGFGHDSVAKGHQGWVFWVKDAVEAYDGIWALVLATAAWSLGRTGIVGSRPVAVLGVLGGLGFALFSFAIPLTGPVIAVTTLGPLVPRIAPAFGMLLIAWTLVCGISILRKRGEPVAVHPSAARTSSPA